MSYGISCWPHGDSRACDRSIEDRSLEGRESFMTRAGKEGWVIGHWDGQAYYCCPEHQYAVWDPSRLQGVPTHRPYSVRATLNRAKLRARAKWKRGGYRRYAHTALPGFRFLNAQYRLTWAEQRERVKEKR